MNSASLPSATSAPDFPLHAQLISLTQDLVAIPGTAAHPEELSRCLDFARDRLLQIEGLRFQEFLHEGSSSLLILPQGITRPEILLAAHLDVVVHAQFKAYQAHVANGRIWGPGAGDMKGQAAVLLTLFEELHQQHPGISLGLALTTDEETGGEHGMGHLFGAAGLRCGALLLPDGGSVDTVTVEEKGVLNLKLSCHGPSAHAARPWLAPNPLQQLVQALGRIETTAASWRTPESHWHPTAVATRLRCPNETTNRIPDYAEAILDVRVAPPWTAHQILAELAAAAGAEIKLDVIRSSAPTSLTPEAAYLRAMEGVLGSPPQQEKSDGASDARFAEALGIPVLMSRPLVGNLHAVDEWIDIDSMVAFYRYCKRYLLGRLTEGC